VSGPAALTPEEVEDFLRETFEMDAQFWIEEGDTEMLEHDLTDWVREAEEGADLSAYQGKRYEITRDRATGRVRAFIHQQRACGGESMTELAWRLDLFNHSPDGFEYGYSGSGPAQLALALLADALGNDYLATWLHQPFKERTVAAWSGDRIVITAETVRSIAADLRAELAPPDPFEGEPGDDPPGGWPETAPVEYADPFADDAP